jgi:hypothetical protein
LTLRRNVVAYGCRPSRAEDRRHAHRSAFFGCPSTGDQGFSHQRFAAAAGIADWRIACGNCGNPRYGPPARYREGRAERAERSETPIGAQHRRPAPEGCQAAAESWVRWWVGITASGKDGGFIALFCNKWRRGWDSNPRYACTHNGFRDRPDRPLWHLSGGPLIGGRFRRGNRGQTSAISARNQGFAALTWGASCVYSALLGGSFRPAALFRAFRHFGHGSGQSPYLLWGGW